MTWEDDLRNSKHLFEEALQRYKEIVSDCNTLYENAHSYIDEVFKLFADITGWNYSITTVVEDIYNKIEIYKHIYEIKLKKIKVYHLEGINSSIHLSWKRNKKCEITCDNAIESEMANDELNIDITKLIDCPDLLKANLLKIYKIYTNKYRPKS